MKIDSTFPKIGFTGVNFSGKSVQIATGRKDRLKFGIRKETSPVSVQLQSQVGGFCKLERFLPLP